MAHHIEDSSSFYLEIAKNRLTVVDFFAQWCGPCKFCAPLFEELAKKYAGAGFFKVDVDQLSDIAQYCQITAMPTFHLYKNDQKVGEVVGADMNQLESLIKQHIGNSNSYSGTGRKLGDSSSGTAGTTYVNPFRLQKEQSNTTAKDVEATKKPGLVDNDVEMTEDEMLQVALELSKNQVPPTKDNGTSSTGTQPSSVGGTTSTTTTNSISSSAAESSSSVGSSSSNNNNDKNNSKTLSGDELLNLLEKTVDQEMLKELLSMEFSRLRAVKSLLSTNSKSLEAAAEWLVNHQDDKDIDEPLQQVVETPEEQAARIQMEAQRMKNIIAQKKKEKEEKAKLEQIEAEKERREFGKKAIQQKAELDQAQRERDRLAAKLEKEEANKRLKMLREQQERDRERRRAEQLKLDGDLEGNKTVVGSSTSTLSSESVKPSITQQVSSTKKEFTDCTLQIRLLDGSAITEKFAATDTLLVVKSHLEAKIKKQNFNLMTNFPRKVFSGRDLKLSLKDAGFCPRGQLICTLSND